MVTLSSCGACKKDEGRFIMERLMMIDDYKRKVIMKNIKIIILNFKLLWRSVEIYFNKKYIFI
jgi:hypothetical protein